MMITAGFDRVADFEYFHTAEIKKMLGIAKSSLQGSTFLRKDLCNADGVILFDEMTFYHVAGFEKFSDFQHDVILGSWLALPQRGN